ncbi:Peroxidase, family 2 [Rhizoctonia solani]|uniref:Peroxidase, family 2 n=1 Tax=Rhizoctonia solani TaxID=456999 RepID=A0A8H7I8H0_9AGAM|nr:Peroxidase, family 2 [Rhizoctonia solani]
MRNLLAGISLALATSVLAFPATGKDVRSETSGCPFAASSTNTKRQSNAASSVNFDPVKQKVDVAGKYKFRPPGATDKRALSNHGYLPHNGVTTFTKAIEASNEVFGMGTEIATLLSALGVLLDGNPLTFTWSIGEGGPTGELVLPPLLASPQGLSGSHNKYEGDSSPTRWDAYMNNGDGSTMNLTYFKQLYDRLPEGDPEANFDYSIITANRVERFKTSVSDCPGLQIADSDYQRDTQLFLWTLQWGNCLRGCSRIRNTLDVQPFYRIASRNVESRSLKSFFGVSGNSANLTYQQGYERIPTNWYRRPTNYALSDFRNDLLSAALEHPEFLSIGGNTGKVNSFAGVSLNNLTGGVYNSINLLQGNNLFCFAFQAAQQAVPDVLKGGILGDLVSVLNLLTSKITPILSGLGCPQLTKYDKSAFSIYPGSRGTA